MCIRRCLLSILCLFSTLAAEKPYVIGNLLGQTGNMFFQIATASALAWDHGAEPCFPDLLHTPSVYAHFFSRCNIKKPTTPVAHMWQELGFPYSKIPFRNNMSISGYYQSEKYFAHHRTRLLELFAPTDKDLQYIRKRYASIINNPNTVGIQIRYYQEDVHGETFIQYGKDYLEKAMALFPKDSLFIVSSNHMEFAKKNVPTQNKNVLFLENEKSYIDFYILTMCKHNIITNSTFGWWSSWLNQNPNQKVVCPKAWLNCFDTKDLCPERWIKIDAKRGRISDPQSY